MSKLLSLAFFYLLFAQLDSAVSSPLLEETLELLHEYDKRELTNPIPTPDPPVIKFPVISKFVTTEVTNLDLGKTFILKGSLCRKLEGMAVNVSVTLYNNPLWNSNNGGIIRYFVVDSPEKEIDSALCVNVDEKRIPISDCIVPSWHSTNDMYIKGMAVAGKINSGPVPFSLAAEFYPQGSERATYIQQRALTNQNVDESLYQFPTNDEEPTELTEEIIMSDSQQLAYGNVGQLEFSFCPTTQYQVRGTVMATDKKSSFTQCMCDAWPCKSDPGKFIACNNLGLPLNEVTSNYDSQWEKIYITIKCFSGPYDVVTSNFICNFLFSAQMV